MLVPQAVAYAALAGAPPQAGLFTALAAGVLYAVFGTCRELEVGPSSTISITAAAALIPVAAAFPNQQYTVLLATLAVLTGVALLLAGALRLGLVAQFLARPVILGFISGIGIVIIVGQIPNLLGITVESGNVPETIWRILGSLDEAGWRTALVGGVVARSPARAPPARPPRPLAARGGRRRGRLQSRLRSRRSRRRRDRGRTDGTAEHRDPERRAR